jgi:hypothetical protein
MAQAAVRNDINATVLTASSGGHTIVAIITAMRCLFIHSARQFQKRKGAGYCRLPRNVDGGQL